MNDKKDEEYNNINGNDVYSNQSNSQKNTENKEFKINNRDKLSIKETKLKIPDIQILDMDSINCRYVNLKDDLINYSNHGNIKILDLNIKNYININVKTFQFNDLILSNSKIKKIINPDFQIIKPAFIQLKKFQFNDFITNNKTYTSNVFIPNLNTIAIRPVSIFGDVNFNSKIYLEIKKLININIAGTLDGSSSNNNNFYDDLKLPWDENNSPFKGLINNANKFLIIAVDNKYSEFIAINYRDIYRIYNGGFPDIERVENISELEKTLQQTGQHKLIIVKNAIKSDHLEKIIDNAPYQQSGCIILDTDDVSKFKLYNSNNITIIDDDIFRVLETYGEKLINAVSGFICNSFNNMAFSDFAQNFQKAIINFDEKIENYSNIEYLKKHLRKELYQYIIQNMDLLVNTNSETEKNATHIHAGMKGFICVYKSSNPNNKIFLEGKNESDVYVTNNNVEEFYEAETFFGREDPLALIAKKIKKYKEYSGKLIFLMRNVDIIRYFYEFMGLLGTYKNNQGFLQIDICGFNFKNNRIESIKKIANYLTK